MDDRQLERLELDHLLRALRASASDVDFHAASRSHLEVADRALAEALQRAEQSSLPSVADDGDAALAAVLQAEEEALVASALPRAPRTSTPTPQTRPPRPGVCPTCGQTTRSLFSGAVVSALGCSWHAACLRCALCRQPLQGTFSYKPPAPGQAPQPCHEACFRNAFHPRCAVCCDLLPQAADGTVSYGLTSVYGDKYCPQHSSDGTPRCFGCERLEARAEAARHAALPDGRTLCVACVATAVVDSADAAPLYDDVLAFFAALGVPLCARPPLRLVDAAVMAALAGRDDAPHSGVSVRGVTMTEEVVLRPVARAAGALFSQQAPERYSRRLGCSVTCIALLSAMPRLLAGAVLAHEACHALLRLSNAYPHPLRPRVEEGLCQLFGLLWLEAQAARLTDPAAVAHSAQLADAIRNDASEVYGGGARDALLAYQAHGLRDTLAAVARTGSLP